MYLWHVHALADQLKKNTITIDKQLHYSIASTIIYMLLGVIPQVTTSDDPVHAAIAAIVTFILQAAIVVWGINYVYHINKRGDNKNFFTRFSCLTVPATVRYVFLAFFVIAPITYFFHGILGITMQEIGYNLSQIHPHLMTITKFFDDILLLALTGIYYLYLGNKIKYISNA